LTGRSGWVFKQRKEGWQEGEKSSYSSSGRGKLEASFGHRVRDDESASEAEETSMGDLVGDLAEHDLEGLEGPCLEVGAMYDGRFGWLVEVVVNETTRSRTISLSVKTVRIFKNEPDG
jgi:hypothetical protein